jgi:hypothetical protein
MSVIGAVVVQHEFGGSIWNGGMLREIAGAEGVNIIAVHDLAILGYSFGGCGSFFEYLRWRGEALPYMYSSVERRLSALACCAGHMGSVRAGGVDRTVVDPSVSRTWSRRSVAKEREHCEHAAVDVSGSFEVELLEHVGAAGFDRSFTDSELVGDAGV